MFFYSNVPLVNKNFCPRASDHNFLAKQFNNRLTLAGPACPWSIFYYADSIFTGMRNTATPGIPIGVNPPEDEWWKIYACIEQPTGETGEGNWPLTLAGYPEGANVMNPLNAWIFGRKTAENKFIEEMGPWAEGNGFDGLVQSSRAVLSNSQYWSDSFRQRGAIMPNHKYNASNYARWRSGELKYKSFANLSHTKYLPSIYDPQHISKGLFQAGRSSDKFFEEYASNTVYARYAPAVYGGGYKSVYAGEYRGTVYPSHGVLKRKNAAKDVLRWGLWAYTFYFRGSELQRSLFCERKDWDAPKIEFDTTKQYIGQQTIGLDRVRTHGPLNICQVGFDFFKYYTRQNVLAPVFGTSIIKKGRAVSYDGTGNARVEQYKPTFKFTIDAGSSSNNWLGNVNGKDRAANNRHMSNNAPKNSNVTSIEVKNYDMAYENYDDIEIGATDSYLYGKALRFPASDVDDRSPNDDMLFTCTYENGPSGYGKVGDKHLFVKTNTRQIPYCLAGYYFQTSAVENPALVLKLRIWRQATIVHETIINRRFSYAVNRTTARDKQGRRAYVYNKIFYFKNPPISGKYRFEIVAALEDNLIDSVKGDARKHYKDRIDSEDGRKDRVIGFGNPYAKAVLSASQSYPIGTTSSKVELGKGFMWVPSGLVGSGSTQLQTGNAIKVQVGNGVVGDYLDQGKIIFVKIGKESGDRTQVWLSSRQDSRLKVDDPTEGDIWYDIQTALQGKTKVSAKQTAETIFNVIKIYKLDLDDNFFTATLEPAVLLHQRPSFQDAYALLRVATGKKNPMNSMARTIGHDLPGMGTVGHAFHESNGVFRNYLRYGSAVNVFGSEVVPALRQKVSSNPIYESMRKFVSSCMRMADRRNLINYTVENGYGVLYFRRFAWMGLANRSKATILRNMEPSVDPCGRFYEGSASKYGGNGNINAISYAKFVPILTDKWYYMYIPTGGTLKYNGVELGHNVRFKGVPGKQNLESGTLDLSQDLDPDIGAYEIDGITRSNQPLSAIQGGKTNEWVMFMTSGHYSPSSSSIYKPTIYNDIMGFLNNRCHHRSLEYERGMEDKYQMIRTELCRVPDHPSTTPGPRLHIFLSKSPNSYNYIFNTNRPMGGNLDTYDSYRSNYVTAYRKSCPAVNEKVYNITSCKLVNSYGNDLYTQGFNPSAIKRGGFHRAAQMVRVEFYPPLRNTGRLNIGPSGWAGVEPPDVSEGGYNQIIPINTEPYRTDENAVIEYLMHTYLGRGGYNCNRNMIGDYGALSNAREGIGYRPWGACFPRFYFLKLIPLVGQDSLLDIEPYAQMDFYMRAMCGQFVTPFNPSMPGQVDSVNWKYTELASRSAEEDPSSYHYVDPREVQS